MVDFDNPLDQSFLDDIGKAKRDVFGDAITQPRQFIIGRLNADGSVTTAVKDGEFNRVWVREPGDDTGDAVQAVNTVLQAHEISHNRPVMVKIVRGEFVITNKAIESANYDAQLPVAPQRPTNREQYNIALITPSKPDSSFYTYYRGGIFQLNNVAYRITDIPSSDFSGTVPVANALSIKVEIDPVTGTWHETTGSAFTFSSMTAAFKNGDLDTARTTGRYLIGWIRLYDGQTAIELDDIMAAEHMLDLIDDHGALTGLGDDDHAQYVHITPASSARNVVQPTAGDYDQLILKNQAGYITFAATKEGWVGMGTDAPWAPLNVADNYTDASSRISVAIDNHWQPATTSGGEFNGALFTTARFDSTASPSTSSTNIAYDGFVWNSNSGVIDMIAYNAQQQNSGGGTVVNSIGYKAQKAAGANITNEYGFYAELKTVGTNKYGFYDEGNANWFNASGAAGGDFTWSSDTETNMFFGDAGTEQVSIGGTTNGIQIAKGGDTWWTGTAGLVMGHMYIPGVDIIVDITDANPTEVLDDGTTSAGDGWSAGELNLVTFPTGGTEHYLTVTKAGKYRVTWDMSFQMAAPGANIEIHGGIMVDDTATRNKGEAHRTIANNSDTGNMGSTGVIDCPNGTEEISLWVENADNNNDVTVEHGNMYIELVGGT